MSKFQVEIIERGIELSNNDLFDVLGGAADCVCRCVLNFRVLCTCAVEGALKIIRELPGTNLY